MPFKSTRHVYKPLAQQSLESPLDDIDLEQHAEQAREDSEIADTIPPRYRPSSRDKWSSITTWTLKAVALALAAVLVFEMWDSVGYVEDRIDRYQATAERCTVPAQRPSWRALDAREKKQYINAVKCLANTPSAIHPGSSMYDDFTYIHIVHGNALHFASGNLPWHRLHLHAWEQAMQRECGYTGQLPYWDWDAEYENIIESSVFDETVGFGGDGNQSAGPLADKDKFVLDGSRCVASGPFTDLRPRWFAELTEDASAHVEYQPHCITRAFTGVLSPPDTRPDIHVEFGQERIKELMAIDRYSEFNLAVEAVHDWLPLAARGDFASLAAPNDPLFYLHLANIDRIWWQWQQRDLEKRLFAYDGKAQRGLTANATLSDPVAFQAYPGLYRLAQVKDLMDTQSGALGMCYSY